MEVFFQGADVLSSSLAVVVVGLFDEAVAGAGGGRAVAECVFVGWVGVEAVCAKLELVTASARRLVCLLHEAVNAVVDRFDAVCIVHRKLGVVRRLDLFVYEAADYAERIHRHRIARDGAIPDGFVLVAEVSVKGRAI